MKKDLLLTSGGIEAEILFCPPIGGQKRLQRIARANVQQRNNVNRQKEKNIKNGCQLLKSWHPFFISTYVYINTSPFITAGISKPIIFKIVGAISPSLPFFTVPFQLLSITKNGTGFNVCAVFAVPSSFIS
jgi:hypothetical protein